MNFQQELNKAKQIARLSGKIILEYFDKDQETQQKDDGSPVTKADVLVNELVIKELQRAFPKDGIVCEEKSTTEHGQGRIWLCDPIDGTAGYVWGIPTAMFSLALVIDGEPTLGVTYDAFLDRLYEGVKDHGSYCNGVKLEVSKKGLNKGHVAITASVEKIRTHKYIPKLQAAGAFLPVFSGAVYKSCLVAKGKFEGYIEYGVSTYDIAAIQMIVEEAGGKVTNLKGKRLDYSAPFKGAIVSNTLVHDKLVEAINN
jgi:fructose-1,6-bisphosphatase/inositol monophosphatase family enzyme